MPRVSARKQRFKIMTKASVAARKNRNANNNSTPEVNEERIKADNDINSNRMEVENNTITPVQTEILPISWNNQAEEESKKYSRTVEYSERHQRRIRKKNEVKAKGSQKIDTFFLPVSNITAFEIEKETIDPIVRINKEEYLAKIQIALDSLSKFAIPVNNAKSIQQKIGPAEMAKYECVYHYFSSIINSNLKKIEASKFASDLVYKSKSTIYRAMKVRRYADEYVETGTIAASLQGKHPKRFSVIDDEDINKPL